MRHVLTCLFMLFRADSTSLKNFQPCVGLKNACHNIKNSCLVSVRKVCTLYAENFVCLNPFNQLLSDLNLKISGKMYVFALDSRLTVPYFVYSILSNIKRFIERMLDPGVGTGAVDVYAWMFGCQFIVFLIIIFNWSAFSSPEVSALGFYSDSSSSDLLELGYIALIKFYQSGRYKNKNKIVNWHTAAYQWTS